MQHVLSLSLSLHLGKMRARPHAARQHRNRHSSSTSSRPTDATPPRRLRCFPLCSRFSSVHKFHLNNSHSQSKRLHYWRTACVCLCVCASAALRVPPPLPPEKNTQVDRSHFSSAQHRRPHHSTQFIKRRCGRCYTTLHSTFARLCSAVETSTRPTCDVPTPCRTVRVCVCVCERLSSASVCDCESVPTLRVPLQGHRRLHTYIEYICRIARTVIRSIRVCNPPVSLCARVCVCETNKHATNQQKKTTFVTRHTPL